MKRKNSEAQITDMTRFPISIRSLLWLMVAVAMKVGWDHCPGRQEVHRKSISSGQWSQATVKEILR